MEISEHWSDLALIGQDANDPARTCSATTTQLRMPTARDATSAIVASEIEDSAIISSLALTVSGKVSAGENAVAFVNAKNR